MMMRIVLAAVAAHALQLPAQLTSLQAQLKVPPLPELPDLGALALPDLGALALPDLGAFALPALSLPRAPALPQAPDGSVGDLATRLLSEVGHALQGDWTPYASVMAASCAATVAVTLPALLLTGAAERKRQARTKDELPVEAAAPYAGGATTYSPAKANEFYGKQPLVVLERLAWLTQATFAFNVKLLIDYARGWPEASEKDRAKECLALCEELGPTFIKLGQALSIRSDLISEAYALELRKLQDAVPPFSDAQATAILQRDLGVRDLSDIFEELTPSPIASASIGQVYKGTLRKGSYQVASDDDDLGEVREVAVKVRRPGVLADIALDLYVLRLLTPLQVRVSNAVNKVKTEQEDIDTALALVDEWGRGFVNEVDYVAEATNTAEFSRAMRKRGLGAVISPRVVTDLLRENVLVTEWIDGTRLDASASPDVPRLCGVAINAYLTMLLDTGTLHCDPHPGNLLRTYDGRLCILDWGMTLQVPGDLQYALLEFIAHVNTEDLDEIPQDFVNLGFTPPDQLERVKNSGITDGFSFMLKQLSGGGGAKQVQQRLQSTFEERYGTTDKEEIREMARAEMMENMEKQLASEGVDVRGVSNVMEELSKRNRELFQLPTWVLYVVRAFSTLEGIGLSSDENYAILKECYPYLARRLFKDDSPRARAALSAMIYGKNSDSVDVDKFSEMIEGFASYTSATSGAGLTEQGASSEVVLMDADKAASDAQKELIADVLFAEDSNLVQETVVKEAASLLDASVRAALTDAIDATPFLAHKMNGESDDGPLRSAIQQLRNLPGPARAALLPLTGGVEAAAALAEAVAPLVKADERDRKTLSAVEKIGGLVSDGEGVDPQRALDALSSNSVDLRAVATLEAARRAGLVGRRFAAAVLDRAAERSHDAGAEAVSSAARQASDAVRPATKASAAKEEVPSN